MATHPAVAAAAQAEIDRVVGQERLPNNDDEKHLPYVCVSGIVLPAPD